MTRSAALESQPHAADGADRVPIINLYPPYYGYLGLENVSVGLTQQSAYLTSPHKFSTFQPGWTRHSNDSMDMSRNTDAVPVVGRALYLFWAGSHPCLSSLLLFGN